MGEGGRADAGGQAVAVEEDDSVHGVLWLQ
jgi:hypothetical protein